MSTAMLPRPRPGRSGGQKSLRRGVWEAIATSRALLLSDDERVRVDAARAITEAAHIYRLLLPRAEEGRA